MDLGMVITLAVALVVGVAICLFAITKTHHGLSKKFERSKSDHDES